MSAMTGECEFCETPYSGDLNENGELFCECDGAVIKKQADELAQLRAEVERLTADLAAARAERDALKAELAAAQQWVDPAERLPEQDCVVWACRKTASGLREVCRAFVDDYDVWRIDTLSAGRITVTHWQEITAPQLPSNEQEQKDGEG